MPSNSNSPIIFVAGPALGHIGRLYRIARELRKLVTREIVFVTTARARFAERILTDEFELTKIAGGASVFPEITFADGLEDFFADRLPALVVYDMDPLKWLSGVRFPNCPRVLITNFFLTEPAALETFQTMRFSSAVGKKVAAVRHARGLAELNSAYDLYKADRVLLADPPSLIKNFGCFPDNHFAVGPCCWSPEGHLPETLTKLADIMLLSMGSTGHQSVDLPAIERIADWCGAKATVSIGTDRNIAADFSFDWISLERTLSRSRILVSHGGAGSTYLALSLGVPVIVIPQHRNHELLGQILEAANLGICIEHHKDLEHIEEFKFSVLADHARRLAAETSTTEAAKMSARHIKEML